MYCTQYDYLVYSMGYDCVLRKPVQSVCEMPAVGKHHLWY